MFSIAITEPGKVRIIEIRNPASGPYDAVVKTEISYFCNRTDRKLIDGSFPGVNRYPVLLGHESVGTVVSIGEKVRTFKVGDRAVGGVIMNPLEQEFFSFFGGFSEYTLVKDHRAMVEDGVADEAHGWSEYYQIQRAVPPDIWPEVAGLLCTWREVYATFSDFCLTQGDDVLVFGAGPVGLSFVKFAKLLGLGYVGSVDPHPEKRSCALAMGADEAFHPKEQEIMKLPHKRGKALDAVIDAVGKREVVDMGVSLIKMSGSICVYGVIDDPVLRVDKQKAPLNFNLIIHQCPTRNREAEAQEPVTKWLREGSLKPESFISAEFPIARIADAVQFLKTGRALKILLRY